MSYTFFWGLEASLHFERNEKKKNEQRIYIILTYFSLYHRHCNNFHQSRSRHRRHFWFFFLLFHFNTLLKHFKSKRFLLFQSRSHQILCYTRKSRKSRKIYIYIDVCYNISIEHIYIVKEVVYLTFRK